MEYQSSTKRMGELRSGAGHGTEHAVAEINLETQTRIEDLRI